jgi:hypothetical protein
MIHRISGGVRLLHGIVRWGDVHWQCADLWFTLSAEGVDCRRPFGGMDMTAVIARSRIGFWTAFLHEGVPHLNVREPVTLRTVTVRLGAHEGPILAGDSDAAHALARALAADVRRRSNHVLETPPVGAFERVVHDWEPVREIPAPRLMAA